MTICILGRQPEIGLAELEALYGASKINRISSEVALVDAMVDFSRLGGSIKAAELLTSVGGAKPSSAFSKIKSLLPQLVGAMPAGKVKLGLSLYGFDMSPYAINGEALRLKKTIKNHGRSARVVPNETAALSSAQTYHNSLCSELGLEFVIVFSDDKIYIGRVTHVQDIDAYRIRDRERPKRDAFVGMLPPKLAQIIVNLSLGQRQFNAETYVLDPFCGTGVVLQEAWLMGYAVYGSDISPKMVDYSRANLDWLAEKAKTTDETRIRLETADAKDHIWRQPLDIVACEGYLGQPLGGQNPSEEKLREIIHDCNSTMRAFLKNIRPQLSDNARLCVAMPAWFVGGKYHHLPVIDELESLDFKPISFIHAPESLLYRREDQVTGRELVVLEI